ncbi:hypothetical protein HU200_061441 [Digitaria exilis]|uniref:AAA-type ATPase N-terminal domain-containing protein n=1 Tax=Digitaria exilis TaxID=1010633 RepID=A0A835DZC2_9POAL|nr:hypothetical protein HU200_061441 [Digitaria exilis]
MEPFQLNDPPPPPAISSTVIFSSRRHGSSSARCSPRHAWRLFSSCFKRRAKALLELVDTDVTLDIVRRDWEDSIKTSDKYSEVKAYLAASCSRAARALRAENAVQGDNKLVLTMRLGQGVSDEFSGVTLWWTSTQKREEGERLLRRCYRLTFHHRHRDLVENEYLPHVLKSGREALFANRCRRLYSNNIITENSYWDRVWDFVYLKHPTTFDKLAMDPAKKEEIMDDLDEFRKAMEAWVPSLRPAGTGNGKSSMIAAMANYLNYDIYHVEITVLLAEITEKSIIVIEDIDCSLDLTGERRRARRRGQRSPSPDYAGDDHEKPSKVTLSGLLNFINGLCASWFSPPTTSTSCGQSAAPARQCWPYPRSHTQDHLARVGDHAQRLTATNAAEQQAPSSTFGIWATIHDPKDPLGIPPTSPEEDADGEAAKSAGEKKGRRRRGRKKKKQEKAEVTPEADAKAATVAAAPAPEMKQEMAEVTSEADSEVTNAGAPAAAAESAGQEKI